MAEAPPCPPTWLGDDGEAELASLRMLVSAPDLAARFDTSWGHYLELCTELGRYARRVADLEEALADEDANYDQAALGRIQTEVERTVWYRSQREDSARGHVTDIEGLVREQRRRDVYATAAKRWTSRRRAAEARLEAASSASPGLLAGAVLVTTYTLVLLSAGRAGLPAAFPLSAGSAAAVVTAVVVAGTVFLVRRRSQRREVREARRAVAETGRFEQGCLRAATGQGKAPKGSLRDTERKELAEISRLRFVTARGGL